MRNVFTETQRAFRSLMKRPAMTALIVIPLALGLGANAAIFALIDAVILRPFTIPGVDRVVMLSQTAPDGELDIRETVAPANYFDWKKSVTSVEHMAAFDFWDVNLAGGDASERVSGFYVTADFFAALDVAPAIGRAFLKDEETPGQHQRVILSHRPLAAPLRGRSSHHGQDGTSRHGAVRDCRRRTRGVRTSRSERISGHHSRIDAKTARDAQTTATSR